MAPGFEERRHPTLIAEAYRSEYEIDKARIIHSEAFRRLQSKTQVLQVSESDFHRTRLTHSIEVAQIGKGISRFIEYANAAELDKLEISINHDLIESLCLAHDIGHPPFGHGGEIALNYMMRNHGGYEANGQTLRVINAMNLTRRTCLGLLKYPCAYSKLWNPDVPRQEVARFHQLNQIEWNPPKCFFDEDKETVEWILQTFSSEDRQAFIEHVENPTQNYQARHKSFDCSIMNVADDISYAVHDFEDGFELGVFRDEAVRALLATVFSNDQFIDYLRKKQYTQEDIARLKQLQDLKRFISVCVGFLIANTRIAKSKSEFASPYLQYNVELNEEGFKILCAFTQMVWDNIIQSPRAQQMVKNGQIIVCNLFDVFEKNPQILPTNTQDKLHHAQNPQRVICDYISGMTDRYAFKMYSKIFGSEVISIFEK